uniref:Major facilitator superfamily (MFS) profile domain-containing protein n=1 Tax=Acrobeloides nanus TaxID=290746 RepID=A0A914BXQ3_9BILA
MTNGGSIVAITTYIHELVLPQQRMAIKTYTNWGTVRLITTWICYYVQNWRYASMICSLCALPALIIIIFVFPESPPWLYSKKKYAQLKETQAYIAKIGKTPFVEVPQGVSTQKMNYLDIWKNSKARILIIIMCFMWFTASITSYTNDLNSTAMPGSFWLVQSLFSIVGCFASVALGLTDHLYQKLNRRNLHHYNQFLAILCFIGVGFLFAFKLEGYLLLAFYIVGCMCIGYTWDACYLCTIESVPTSVRGAALGTCSLVARIGALLSPALALLASWWQPAAYIVVCLIGTLNLVLSWKFLPDTKGIDLTQVRVKLHHIEENAEIEPITNEEPKIVIENFL